MRSISPASIGIGKLLGSSIIPKGGRRLSENDDAKMKIWGIGPDLESGPMPNGDQDAGAAGWLAM